MYLAPSITKTLRAALPAGLRPLMRDFALHALVPQAHAVAAAVPDGRVTIIGVFRAPTGLGEGARLTAQTLAVCGYQVGMIDVTADMNAPGGVAMPSGAGLSAGDVGGPLVIHLNPPDFQTMLCRYCRQGNQRQRIAYWNWELPEVSRHWQGAFAYAHRVWTSSSFTAQALRRADCPVPLSVLPYAVPPPPLAKPPDWPGIDPEVLVILNVFSFDSGFERKNPLAAIAAFKRAFGARNDALLVIKSGGIDPGTGEQRRLRAAIGDAPNIRLLSETLSADDYAGLFARADILLSLHRAEGFGLPLAQALMAGKPVVATGWSGNMDFMTKDAACLVDYRMVPVQDRCAAYRDSACAWAEPDIDDAAAALVRLASPQVRRTVGEKGRQHAAGYFSPDYCAAAVLPSLGRVTRPW